LSLAARELVRVAPAELIAREPDQGEELRGPLGDPVPLPSQQIRHEPDVSGYGEVREEPHLLDHIAGPSAERHRVPLARPTSGDTDFAPDRLEEPVHELEDGRLADPRAPHQDDRLVRPDGERETVEKRAAVRDRVRDPVELDRRDGRRLAILSDPLI
jgi:hypothetical protein